MKRLALLSVPIIAGSIILPSQPTLAVCYGLLNTYGGCNYWELPGASRQPSYSPNSGIDYRQNAVPSSPALTNSVPFKVSKNRRVIVSTESDILNVRSSPDIQSLSIGTVAKSSSHHLSGQQSGGWVQLSSGGWVHSQYLNPYPLITFEELGKVSKGLFINPEYTIPVNRVLLEWINSR